eukprot:scaffold301635_cov19-Tisochrysis_lutea.AAC.1
MGFDVLYSLFVAALQGHEPLADNNQQSKGQCKGLQQPGRAACGQHLSKAVLHHVLPKSAVMQTPVTKTPVMKRIGSPAAVAVPIEIKD